jgi:hypothetical protein
MSKQYPSDVVWGYAHFPLARHRLLERAIATAVKDIKATTITIRPNTSPLRPTALLPTTDCVKVSAPALGLLKTYVISALSSIHLNV